MNSQRLDSRHHARSTFGGTVAMWRDREPQLVRARDLSAGGLFLATEQRLGEGSLLTLRLNLPGERGITALGRVVRTQIGRAPLKLAGVAVEFVDIRPRDRARVQGYVERAGLAHAS